MDNQEKQKAKVYEAKANACFESETYQRQRASLSFPAKHFATTLLAIIVALYLFNCSAQVTTVACIAHTFVSGAHFAA